MWDTRRNLSRAHRQGEETISLEHKTRRGNNLSRVHRQGEETTSLEHTDKARKQPV